MLQYATWGGYIEYSFSYDSPSRSASEQYDRNQHIERDTKETDTHTSAEGKKELRWEEREYRGHKRETT
jgi:hypothetical protein